MLCAELHAEVVLVRKGQSPYTIVVGEDCSPPEQHAAHEPQRFIQEISNARLPLTDSPSATCLRQGCLFVGQSSALNQLAGDIAWRTLGEEGFVIKRQGTHLILAGGKGRGSLYACYDFLYRYLDCRWFTPTVSRIPRRETITLPDIDIYKQPVLEYRDIFYYEAWDGHWSARNHVTGINSRLEAKHGGKLRYHNQHFAHTVYDLVPPSQYFATHPEYFAEINGRRVGDEAQLCLSNPEVLEIATASVRRWAKEDPDANIISVSETDWHGHCECPTCRKLIDQEASYAGPLLHFINQIAEQVRAEFPELSIGMLAYNHLYSRIPPQQIKPRPNVIVRLVTSGCCRFHPLATCRSDFDYEGSVQFRQDLAGWRSVADRLYAWNYVSEYGDILAPFPNLDVLQSDIKFFVENRVKGVFCEGISGLAGGEFAELRAYLLARFLWDPECNGQQVRQEFLAAYYGEAAPFITSYLDLFHQHVATGDMRSQRDTFMATLPRP